MEISTLPNGIWYPDLDYDRDPIGLIVEKEVRCGYCGISMKKVGGNTYRCPKCGQGYEDHE